MRHDAHLPGPIHASHADVVRELGVAQAEAPLSHLVASGDVKGIQELMATNDIGSEDLRNALIVACTISWSEPLRILITHGVDVNARTLDGKLPLDRAARHRYMDKLLMLLDAGADPNATVHRTPLLQSLCHESESYGVVALLIERGADVHATNEKGWQALHVAAAQSPPNLTATLLRAGADPNARDDEGKTPIQIATYHGHAANMRLLLDAGAAIPETLEAESYWDEMREWVEEDLGDQEAAARKITELRRIVRSAVLARDLKAAMPNDDSGPGPRRPSGPSPL